MKLIVQEGFKWAHRGVEVEEFQAGAEIETEDSDLITVSTSEGWTVEAGSARQIGSSNAPEDETPVDPAPPAGDADPVETPPVPKRGRAAK